MPRQTEKPTRKKLEDARKKGQIARSRDLALAAASVAATIALARLGGRLIGGLGDRLAGDLLRARRRRRCAIVTAPGDCRLVIERRAA